MQGPVSCCALATMFHGTDVTSAGEPGGRLRAMSGQMKSSYPAVGRGWRTREAVVPVRRIPFAGALNFRDIGGYPVRGGGLTRWGAVYRSDSLHTLTAADLPAFDALGVKTIYDLRRAREIQRWPGPREYVHLEIPGGELDLVPVTQLRTRRDAEEWLASDYAGILRRAAPAFGNLFTRLAGDELLPVVLHCLGGKDRTGLSVALLLTLLRVDRDTVLDDYELTSECQRPRFPEIVELFAASGMRRDAAEGVLGTPRWAMARALSELDDTYSGIEPYLLGPCGIALETITALRNCLTKLERRAPTPSSPSAAKRPAALGSHCKPHIPQTRTA